MLDFAVVRDAPEEMDRGARQWVIYISICATLT